MHFQDAIPILARNRGRAVGVIGWDLQGCAFALEAELVGHVGEGDGDGGAEEGAGDGQEEAVVYC